MEACSMVYAKLDELNIPYDVVEHPAVYTTDEADAVSYTHLTLPTSSRV